MNNPKLISTWAELAECVSDTHTLEINVDGGHGWIRSKEQHNGKHHFDNNHYLSTHTFYGKTHEWSTQILQQCGFDVVVANWDEKTTEELNHDQA